LHQLIFILGSGRSGTTWLLDLLTSHPSYRSVFEPLHPSQIPQAALWANQYLTAESEATDLERHLWDSVGSTTTTGRWRWMTARLGSGPPLRHLAQRVLSVSRLRPWPHKTVVKLIHANLMVDWLQSRFDAPIVFLLRDPLAVVRSQLGMGWDTRLDVYLRQERLMDAFFAEHVDFLTQMDTPAERLAARWAFENLPVLWQMKSGMTTVILETYESLVRRGAEPVRHLMRTLGYTSGEIRWAVGAHTFSERVRSGKRRSTAAPLERAVEEAAAAVLERLGWRPELVSQLRNQRLDASDECATTLDSRSISR